MLLAGAMSSEEVEFVFVDVEEGSESDEGESEALAGGGRQKPESAQPKLVVADLSAGEEGVISNDLQGESLRDEAGARQELSEQVLERSGEAQGSRAEQGLEQVEGGGEGDQYEQGREGEVAEGRGGERRGGEGERAASEASSERSELVTTTTPKRNETNIIPHNYIPPPA